jgi:hypothetical protein
VPFQHLPANHGTVNVPLRIDADAFRTRVIRRSRFQIFDERSHASILRATDPNPFLDAGQFVRTGVGT